MKIPSGVYYGIAIALMFGPAILIMNSMDDDNENTVSKSTDIGAYIFIAILIILVVLYFTYDSGKKSKDKWDSGVFDGLQTFSEDTLLQAYIRLGGLMLRKDTNDIKGKMMYLHRYFERHFENSYTRDLTNALNASFHNPVELKSIAPWLKRNLRSNSQRSQLIYFLAGLGAVDGSLNPIERKYLWQLSEQLNITRRDFDSIMAMYTRYEDTYNQRQQHRQRRASSKSNSEYKREKAAKVLGVSVNASKDEIKKAYRSLVKVHHPDKFAGESESQQKIAEERFIQIQQAYELLFESKH